MDNEKFNRFYDFRDSNAEHWCEIFKITPEELERTEGVMFHYMDSVIELRDKDYKKIASTSLSTPISTNEYYIAFERHVIGLQNFSKFLKTIGTKQEKLEWVEVWSSGLLKTAYHWELDMSEEPDGLVDLFYRNKKK